MEVVCFVLALAPFTKKYSILPVVWLEVTGGDIPDDFMELIYLSTHSANALQSNLRYATALAVIITFSLVIIMYLYNQKREKQASNAIVESVKYRQETVQI